MRNYLKAVIFLLAIGLPALLLAAEGVRIALANTLGHSKSLSEVRSAVSLDPANPDLHYRLGTAEIYGLEDSDPTRGIRQLRRATDLSPRETRYWTALAFACVLEDESACANHAISRSLALSPMTPRVHWEAASYYLRVERQEPALRQFRRLLELDPSYAGQVFRASLGATGSPATVYQGVVTPAASPELKFAYIDFLTKHGHENSAFHVWKDLVANKTPFKFSLVNPYLEHLIRVGKYQQATVVWHDLERRGIVKQSDEHDPANLVFNGSFEHVPLDAGFDWRYRQEPYVTVDFSASHAYKGTYCLRLDFNDVENHRDEPVYQLIPVEAGQDYVLSAYVRSDNINSDSGPRLRVMDPGCLECLNASSGAVVGTTAWHKVILNFRTGPHTRLIRLSVWRPRSLSYPTEILGTLWLDHVCLKAVAPPSGKDTRRQTS